MNRPNLAQLSRELRHVVDRTRALLASPVVVRAAEVSGAVVAGLLLIVGAALVLGDRGPSAEQHAGSSASAQQQADPVPSSPAATGTPPRPGPPPPAPAAPIPLPCQAVARIHEVKQGDTLAAIALRHGSAIEQITGDNRITAPHLIGAGARLTVRSLCAGQAVIRHGDTLSALAQRHGTTVARLAALNPHVTDVDHIVAGGRLVLATAGSS